MMNYSIELLQKFLNYKEILDNSWKRKGVGIIMIS